MRHCGCRAYGESSMGPAGPWRSLCSCSLAMFASGCAGGYSPCCGPACCGRRSSAYSVSSLARGVTHKTFSVSIQFKRTFCDTCLKVSDLFLVFPEGHRACPKLAGAPGQPPCAWPRLIHGRAGLRCPAVASGSFQSPPSQLPLPRGDGPLARVGAQAAHSTAWRQKLVLWPSSQLSAGRPWC